MANKKAIDKPVAIIPISGHGDALQDVHKDVAADLFYNHITKAQGESCQA